MRDLPVDDQGNDLPLDEVFLSLVGAALDNALDLHFSYAGQCFELFSGGGVGVEVLSQIGCQVTKGSGSQTNREPFMTIRN